MFRDTLKLFILIIILGLSSCSQNKHIVVKSNISENSADSKSLIMDFIRPKHQGRENEFLRIHLFYIVQMIEEDDPQFLDSDNIYFIVKTNNGINSMLIFNDLKYYSVSNQDSEEFTFQFKPGIHFYFKQYIKESPLKTLEGIKGVYNKYDDRHYGYGVHISKKKNKYSINYYFMIT